MSTFSRLNRIDQDSLFDVYREGAVDYSLGDFNLFSINTNSNVASEVLVSIPIVSTLYSEDKVHKLFDLDFSEYRETTDVSNQLESEIETAATQNADEYRDKIVELRILNGQGETFSDFSDIFPFEPITRND